MNPIMKAFCGLTIVFVMVLFAFNFEMGVPGWILFIGVMLAMASVVIYDEFMIPGKWPIIVHVYKIRAGDVQKLIKTRGRRIKDRFGKDKYQIRGEPKGKDTTSPVDYRYIQYIKVGGKASDLIEFDSPAAGQFHPRERIKETGEIRVVPQDYINLIEETSVNAAFQYKHKIKSLRLLLENPLFMCSIAFVILLIGIGIFISQFLMPAIQQGQALGIQIQTGTELVLKQQQIWDADLKRLDQLINKLEAYNPKPLLPQNGTG